MVQTTATIDEGIVEFVEVSASALQVGDKVLVDVIDRMDANYGKHYVADVIDIKASEFGGWEVTTRSTEARWVNAVKANHRSRTGLNLGTTATVKRVQD